MSTSSSTSTHSSTIYSESSPRVTSRISKVKQEYDRKVGIYEKEFDVNVSRLNAREKVLRDSMLAYTERMRSISNARQLQDTSLTSELPLFVRAKHIPKFPSIKNNGRRPASLDELIGKQAQRTKRQNPRSASKLSLPALPERYTRSHHVKISFVSASDLYDLVDFSIRNKANKDEALRMKQGEEDILSQVSFKSSKSINGKKRERKEKDNNEKERSPKDTPERSPVNPVPFIVEDLKDQEKHQSLPNDEVSMKNKNKAKSKTTTKTDSKTGDDLNHTNTDDETEEHREENDENTPSSSSTTDHLKFRPNRARRMKLRQPELNIIPENDIISQKPLSSRPSISSPPPKHSPRGVFPSLSSLTVIPEYTLEDIYTGKKKKVKSSRKNESQSAMLDAQNGEELAKDTPQLRTKMKAQKRFKKLIYLRDVPDKHHSYQRS